MKFTILFFIAFYLIETVRCSLDPSLQVSFARVFPNYRRLKRDVVTLSPSAYTEEDKKEMLESHNEFRRNVQPLAADMNLLTWNDQLADSAQSWAEQCIWDHGQVEFENQQYSPMGQNLWRGGRKVSVSAVNAWHNEYKYYHYNNDTCDHVCGHYTQVVWGDTKEVGCGYFSCPDGNTIVACNYGPAGNYNRKPYIEGPSCSACDKPGYCYDDKLCSTTCHDQSVVSGSCKCSYACQNCGVLNEEECTCSCQAGWTGAQCGDVCADTSTRCNNGWYRAQCEGYSYVRTGCPAMCGICEIQTAENAFDCPCNGKTCRNGGQLNTDSCICTCTEGYTGDVCESPVPSLCDGVVCENNGVLVNSTCICQCPDGFEGATCGVGSANIPTSSLMCIVLPLILTCILSHLPGN
ncbi:cysteine-rich secretory protein 3-like isoform X2 [Antedon mediterranea]|uniref:cysteine-rich secretory protein 3-like isoform X2 n=1 Tax=Antedon mediterranea TaxID=105859 RepID=UPI003AF5B131